MKFGGTSMGGAKEITIVADIISEHFKDGKSLVVVPSAMSGVTNFLVSVVDGIKKSDTTSINKDLRAIFDKHMIASNEIGLSMIQKKGLQEKLRDLFIGLKNDVSCVSGNIIVSGEARDRILSYGERMSARILEAKCQEVGLQSVVVDAFDIIETDDNFGEAKPDFEQTKIKATYRINPMLQKGVIPIVTGFIGATRDGRITTLGRGGSDYSASILGWALDAKEVWIWTDVDGVFTSDPNKNPDAKFIDKMRFDEGDAMAKNGNKVLYAKTLEPLFGTVIVVRVKNTFNPSFKGTEITAS
jgi:aspartate kinase